MSWNAYVDTQLVATGAVCQAGIFGKADMQCYANAGDFQVCARCACLCKSDLIRTERSSSSSVSLNVIKVWCATAAVAAQLPAV